MDNTSLSFALIPALGGAVVGYSIAILLFYGIVGIRYRRLREISTHAKIKYWCGFAAFFFFGLGLSTILNAVMRARLEDQEIDSLAIERGAFTAIAPALAFIILALVLLKIKKDGIRASQSNEGRRRTTSPVSSILNKRSLALFAALVAVIVTAALASQFTGYLRRSKDFRLTGCYSCDKEGTCTSNDPVPTELRVEASNVYLFFKSNEQSRILRFPNDSDMKCIIIRDRNFAFDCASSTISGGFLMKLAVTFDGENAFQYDSSTLAAINGIILNRNKITCTIK